MNEKEEPSRSVGQPSLAAAGGSGAKNHRYNCYFPVMNLDSSLASIMKCIFLSFDSCDYDCMLSIVSTELYVCVCVCYQRPGPSRGRHRQSRCVLLYFFCVYFLMVGGWV